VHLRTNPDDVRDRLERIAERLEALSFPTSPMPVDDAQWLAACIRMYLCEEGGSLDQALGLTRKRGGQRNESQEEKIAQVWASSDGSLTVAQLAAEVQRRYPNTFKSALDEKTIQRAVGSVSGRDLAKLTPAALKALGDEIAARLRAR
jgi:hypothetical protein